MRKIEDYWVTFQKSGKIEDYLVFCAVKNDKDKKGKHNEIEHKRTYP